MTDTKGKTIEHIDPATSLPSMNVDHASVFVNELATRLMGFDSGISAVVTEMEGRQKAYEAEQAKLSKDHAAAMEKHHRLKRDLERGRKMALAAQAAYDDDIPVDIDEMP
jgi:hypothetical protein